MIKKSVIIILIAVLPYRIDAQEILDLPADLIQLDETQIDQGIVKIHNFLEYIHESRKLASISNTNYLYSNERWPKGSWGNGFFTDYVEVSNYENRPADFNGWLQGTAYGSSIDYPSSRPMIRYAGRIIAGYINLYGKGVIDDVIVKQRITGGVKFLLDEQLKIDFGNQDEDETGAFMRWYSRPGKYLPNSGGALESGYNQRPEQFDSGFAIEALTGAYFYFKKHSIDNGLFTLDEIVEAIDVAATWMKQHVEIHHNYSHDGSCTVKGHSRNTNQLTCSIWGLINAYKVTKKTTYLESAIDSYERSVDAHQLADGAWTYYQCSNTITYPVDYHDSQGHYTGIILRVLIELYEQVFCEYPSKIGLGLSRQNLRTKILSTINHFLKPGLSNFYDGVRLRSNGEIADHKNYGDGTINTQDIDVALEMFDALIYLQRSDFYKELSITDRLKINKMISAILTPGLDRILNQGLGSYSTAWRSLSYYKRRKFLSDTDINEDKVVLYNPDGDLIDDNKIGIYNFDSDEQIGYSNAGGHFHLMTTGDFDHDGEDEIAMYTRNDGRIAIFNAGYNAYTGCAPVYVGSIYTQFTLHDLMETLDYDGDGYRDEIVMYNRFYSGQYNRIDILDIDGYLSSGYSDAENTFKLITTGDFDQDGKDELALYSDSDGQISIYNPDLATTNGLTIYTGSPPIHGGSIHTQFTLHDLMKALDYDNDGFRDEIVMYNKYYSGYYNRIDILDTNGYISSRYSNAGSTFISLSTGDLDNDGRDEIALYSDTDGQISVYNPEYSTANNNPVAYIGSPPIYSGSIYTHSADYTMMSSLKTKIKDNLQSSARYPQIKAKDNLIETDKDIINTLVTYPNPASNKLEIAYNIKRNGFVKIFLTNLMGQVVDIIEDTYKDAGHHKLEYFNRYNKGVFLLQFQVEGSVIQSKKIIIEK